MKVILLNGPPSSGKDTAMLAIKSRFAATCLRMSAPIKEAFAGMMGLSLDENGNIAGLTQESKEVKSHTLGVSPRQWQIDFSEKFMKPLYGEDIFARIWLFKSVKLAELVVVPDCGFDAELRALVDKLSAKDIFLIRLRRESSPIISGTQQFYGDSRKYVYDDRIRAVDILNEDIDVFRACVLKQVTDFLNKE